MVVIIIARSDLQDDRALRPVVIGVPAFGRLEHQRSGGSAMRPVGAIFFQHAGQDQRDSCIAMPMPRLSQVRSIPRSAHA